MKKYMKVALATKRKKTGKPTKKMALDNYLMVSLCYIVLAHIMAL